MKWSDKFLVLYLTCLPLFRIDLNLQKGSFVFTPTLLVSTLLILVSPFILLSNRAIINRNLSYFILIILLFVTWCFISLFPYYDFLQVKRFLLFVNVTISSLIFLILFNNSENKKRVLNSFITIFLSIYIIYSLGDIYFFMNLDQRPAFYKLFPFYNVDISYISFYLIRLKGSFIDSNIAGYFLIFLYLLSYSYNFDKKKRILIGILVFLTFSRSSIATFLIILLCIYIYNHILIGNKIKIKYAITPKKIKYALYVVLLLVVSFPFVFHYTDLGERISQAVATRVSSKDQSASIHLSLLDLGIRIIFDNTLNFIKGYGFCSSFIFTQDYFPGNKYGNFHSEYITLLVETGIIGLLIFSIIYIAPAIALIFKKVNRISFCFLLCLIAFALENVFYQQYMFHYYWIFLGMIWLLPFISSEEKIPDVLNK